MLVNKVVEEQRALKLLAAAPGREEKVLQTYTVSLQEVKANLEEWIAPLRSEYNSLVHDTKVTKAVRPVKKKDLEGNPDVEYAPGMLVATVKAPDARKRARAVVCGNHIEPSLSSQELQDAVGRPSKKKDWSNYASGLDGTAMRMVLRLAGHSQWTVGSIDVKTLTAFLLAPLGGLLAVRPPRILIQAKLIDEDEVWLV